MKRGEVIFKSGAILEWIWYLIIMYVIRVLPFKVSNGEIRLLLKHKAKSIELATSSDLIQYGILKLPRSHGDLKNSITFYEEH